jgi:hypothetical protein
MRFKSTAQQIVLAALVVGGAQLCHSSGELDNAAIEALFRRHSDDNLKQLDKQWSEIKGRMTNPIENLTLPLDYYPDGTIKARLIAKHSQIFENGTVFASGVEVVMYDVGGQVSGHLVASDCVFDREKSHGYCRGAVEVRYNNDVLKGVGMYFSIADEYIKILSDCMIRTRRFQTNLGRLL